MTASPKVIYRTYGFRIPNLPRETYGYLKSVREATGLSPWQVVILALKALEHVGTSDHERALNLVKEIKEGYPKP